MKENNNSTKKIESILSNVKASLAIEGLELSETEINIIRNYLDGKYTEKEILEIIKKI